MGLVAIHATALKAHAGEETRPGRAWVEYLLVFTWHLGGVVALTWPLLLQSGVAAPGHSRLSVCVHLWQNWWTREAVLQPQAALFFSPMLFYPWGVVVLSEFGNYLLPLLSVPFQGLLGLAGSYNALIFVLFPLAGVAAYSLARRFVSSRAACLLGSSCFVFLPYAWMELFNGALEIAVLVWLPVCLLLLHRALERPGWGRALALGSALFLAGMSSWYYGFYLLLASGLVLGMAFFFPVRFALPGVGRRAALARVIAGVGIVSGLTMYPFVMLLQETSRLDLDWRRMADDGSAMAAKSNPDLLELAGPWQIGHVDEQADFGLRKGVRYPFAVFPGYTVLVLAAFGIMTRRLPAYYGLLAVVFVMLYLGPYLKLGGTTRFLGFRVPLPVCGLASVTNVFAANILHSYRAFVVPSLILCLLAAAGAEVVFDRLRLSRVRRWASALALAALAVPAAADLAHLPVPFPRAEVVLPESLGLLARLHGPGAVVDVPVSVQPHHAYRFLLAQTIHRRPILSGQAFRARSYAELDPTLTALHAVQDGEAPPQGWNPTQVHALAEAGFRFFIVHDDFLDPACREGVHTFLMRFCDVVATDPGPPPLTLYEMRPHARP